MTKEDKQVSTTISILIVSIVQAIMVALLPFFGATIKSTEDSKQSFIILIDIILVLLILVIQNSINSTQQLLKEILLLLFSLFSLSLNFELINSTFEYPNEVWFHNFLLLFLGFGSLYHLEISFDKLRAQGILVKHCIFFSNTNLSNYPSQNLQQSFCIFIPSKFWIDYLQYPGNIQLWKKLILIKQSSIKLGLQDEEQLFNFFSQALPSPFCLLQISKSSVLQAYISEALTTTLQLTDTEGLLNFFKLATIKNKNISMLKIIEQEVKTLQKLTSIEFFQFHYGKKYECIINRSIVESINNYKSVFLKHSLVQLYSQATPQANLQSQLLKKMTKSVFFKKAEQEVCIKNENQQADQFHSPYQSPGNNESFENIEQEAQGLSGQQEVRNLDFLSIKIDQTVRDFASKGADLLEVTVSSCFWNFKPYIFVSFNKQENSHFIKEIKTLKEQCEEQTTISKQKDDILASVTHDFKTPINGIVAILDYLENQTLTEEVKQFLRIIKKSAFLILFMINDISDYARIRNNQFKLCLTTFDLSEIIQEIIELILIQAQHKGIKIVSKIKLSDCIIQSDQTRIKQILLNLVSNSLKFTQKEEVQYQQSQSSSIDSNQLEQDIEEHYSSNSQFQQDIIKIDKQQSIYQQQSIQIEESIQQPLNVIKISVIDSGVGIPEKIIPQLFKMFSTFDTNGVNKNGVGLGLVMCQKLVSLLGPSNKIKVRSKIGVGTKFSFLIYSNLKSVQDIDSSEPKKDNKNRYIAVKQMEESVQVNTKINFPSLKNKIYTSSQILIYSSKPDLMNNQAIQNNSVGRVNDFNSNSQQLPGDFSSSMMEDGDGGKSRNLKKIHLMLKNDQQKINFDPKIPINIPEKASQQEEESESPLNIMKKLLPKNCRVLVVDDEPFNVLAVKLVFRHFPWVQLQEAYNGDDAVKIVIEDESEIRIKYIFMDLTMPIMDGYTATKLIKEQVQKGRIPAVKVVALTGYSDISDQMKCGEDGFDAFIPKPLNVTLVCEALRHIC